MDNLLSLVITLLLYGAGFCFGVAFAHIRKGAKR